MDRRYTVGRKLLVYSLCLLALAVSIFTASFGFMSLYYQNIAGAETRDFTSSKTVNDILQRHSAFLLNRTILVEANGKIKLSPESEQDLAQFEQDHPGLSVDVFVTQKDSFSVQDSVYRTRSPLKSKDTVDFHVIGMKDFTIEGKVQSYSYFVELNLDPKLTTENEILQIRSLHQMIKGLGLSAYWLVSASILSFLLFIILAVFSFCKAGHSADQEGIVTNAIDRIPLEIYFLLFLIPLLIASFILLNTMPNYWLFDLVPIFSGIALSLLMLGLFLFAVIAWTFTFMLGLATRFKAGKWWRHTIAYYLFSMFRYLLNGLPLIWRTAFLGLASLFLWLFLSPLPFLRLLLGLFWAYLILRFMADLSILKKAGNRLAAGDLNLALNTRFMMRDTRKHAENLLSLQNSVSLAVQEQMKSERMQTDLITNVSHDIKTPLTSIINFTDLLHRELEAGPALENPKVVEYLTVIERQANRLKTLLQDLIDASRAASGTVELTLVPIRVSELLQQACGEYEDKIEAAGLQHVPTWPGSNLYVMADGGMFWRILSNVYDNVVKYAQSGTRVYLDTEERNNDLLIRIRNTSKEALNIPESELMERFVREDRARHTEGSGLGLAIARSLAQLMHGQFDVRIDGDLFTVQITLPLCSPPENPAPKAQPEGEAKSNPSAKV